MELEYLYLLATAAACAFSLRILLRLPGIISRVSAIGIDSMALIAVGFFLLHSYPTQMKAHMATMNIYVQQCVTYLPMPLRVLLQQTGYFPLSL